MKTLAVALGALIVLIQYPLWLGKGSWMRAWEVDRQLSLQLERNLQLERRNAGLSAEVSDLKQGTEAIEERARFELGLVRSDEIFFQIEEKGREQAPASAPKAE